MANSEFEYVRKAEQWDGLPLDNWIVVRIDGRGFSKFTKRYNFEKPNDRRAIDLMNAAAVEVMKLSVDIVAAYGQSDEFSFIIHEESNWFERRASKLSTTIATTFSVEYAMQWPLFFPDQPLTRPYPTFDGRTVIYPKLKSLRDYLKWRQADCHINNLYNTTFWNMVLRGGMSNTDAEQELKGTLSADKNEILFSRFKINYNNEPAVFRKGTIIYREQARTANEVSATTTSEAHASSPVPLSKTKAEKERKKKFKALIMVEHVDIIQDTFWAQRPCILGGSRGKMPVE